MVLRASTPRSLDLAGAGSAHQRHVVRLFQELTAVQLAELRLVDRTLAEVQAGQIPVHRVARDLHLVGHRTHLAFGKLGLDQTFQHGLGVLIGG